MPRFKPGSGGGGEGGDALHAADYILAMVALSRKTGKSSGKEYLSCKWEVVYGHRKGASFWDMLGLDFTQSGTVTRWNLLSEACGVTEEIELGSFDEGTSREGDENIRRCFFKKPFVARVSKERNGDYTNNRVERVIPRRQWTQEQMDAIFAYITEHESEREPEEFTSPDDFDDVDPGDDSGTRPDVIGRARPYEGRETRVGSIDDDIDDDDIPF